MARVICLSLTLVLLAGTPASAQEPTARISGPVLGYLLDEDTVRPVFGMPGAATLGPRLALGGEIRVAAIAQQAGYALAAVGPEQRVWLYRNLTGELAPVPLPEALEAPERILLSPSGRAAALVNGSEWVVVTGLPEAPALRRITLPPEARLWAVSDDGAALLIATPAGEAEALQLLGPEGERRFLVSIGKTAAAAFLAGSADAVIADGLHNTVIWVRASGDVLLLAGPADGISEPVAVAVSRDNRRAFVANRASSTVGVLDLAGGPASLVACPCQLTRLEPLEGTAVFRLTEVSGEPVWVFDGDSAEARVVFVPPAAGQAEGLSHGGGAL